MLAPLSDGKRIPSLSVKAEASTSEEGRTPIFGVLQPPRKKSQRQELPPLRRLRQKRGAKRADKKEKAPSKSPKSGIAARRGMGSWKGTAEERTRASIKKKSSQAGKKKRRSLSANRSRHVDILRKGDCPCLRGAYSLPYGGRRDKLMPLGNFLQPIFGWKILTSAASSGIRMLFLKGGASFLESSLCSGEASTH